MSTRVFALLPRGRQRRSLVWVPGQPPRLPTPASVVDRVTLAGEAGAESPPPTLCSALGSRTGPCTCVREAQEFNVLQEYNCIFIARYVVR